jgi:hypothetical protein
LNYGSSHDWTWGDNWLGRIPLFVPTVKAAAGVRLSLGSQIVVAGVYLSNYFEPKRESSGRILLYLASKALSGQGFIIDSAIGLWRIMMRKRFGTPRGLLEVYFSTLHPFSVYGPGEF